MALNGLLCSDVSLRKYSLIHLRFVHLFKVLNSVNIHSRVHVRISLSAADV